MSDLLSCWAIPVLVVIGGALWQGPAMADSGDRQAQPAEDALLRHVVLFRFKENTTDDQIRKVEKAFAALPEKIDTIVDFEWGTNESPEGINDGFTHCFLVTFANVADRDAYLPHPAHKQFVEILRPHLDKALVVDYRARK